VGLVHAVGLRLGLRPEGLRAVERAAALHDVGTLVVPPAVLQKQGPLDDGEHALVQRHAEWGAEVLEPIPRLRDVAPLVRHSHERWDGGGYPDGLAGEAIPAGARILAACAAVPAMTSERPHRAARSVEAALDELRRCAGSQFDPEVVEALAGVVARAPEVV
jgi:HD-GYP domain-containing protein (c-di-GMP phosphodiesterase class II)